MPSQSESARRLLVDSLHSYMLGPVNGDSETLHAGVWAKVNGELKSRITQRPDEFYHIGILYPAGTAIDSEEDDDEADTSDKLDPSPNGIMALANTMRQSAMGVSFRLADPSAPLWIEATWGVYRLDRTEESARKRADDSVETETDGKVLNVGDLKVVDVPEGDAPEMKTDWRLVKWKREPVSWSEAIRAAEIATEMEPKVIGSLDGVDIVALKLRDVEGTSLTLSLVNRRKSTPENDEDASIYQARIVVKGEGDADVFQPVSSGHEFGSDEFWSYELLFRDVNQFAVGHGCSADWTADSSPMMARKVCTTWLPEQEVFKALSTIEGFHDGEILKLESLDGSELERGEVLSRLTRIADTYDQWIGDISLQLQAIVGGEEGTRAKKLGNAGARHIAECETQSKRIRDGIAYLQGDNSAWQAFCLANRAMKAAMQRERPNMTPTWFPFQLAFILISLPSVADPTHAFRKYMDLIWFPTGGGKTEAYLGLAAWTIFHRRLKHGDSGGGTAVFTRYTLRFLTSQQFERTARMILACEVERRRNPLLGTDPISIGLYVGSSVTPNSIKQAEDLLNAATDDSERGGGRTTLPVSKCPWCKSELTHKQQSIAKDRLITRCPSEDCDFSAGIPMVIVDDEIYAYPPTFVVGTIDKFALLPWAPRLSAIFGRGSNNVAPDLIIQDELHLISDSLGSLAGLYESVVDIVCEEVSAIPKIVGSTATIRRAKDQVKALFDRDVLQFPPSGVKSTDSFFFRENRDTPGRLYVGVHAQGRSPKHTQPIIVGLLLQFSQLIQDESIRDPFHTLVLYFNALRELGGAFVLVEDDVGRYLDALSRGKMLPEGMSRRYIQSPLEVSGSIPSELIEQYTKYLEVSLLSEDLDTAPQDVVLATNMISVGVDVGRLGTMVVVGQPKTTSEYIQATSRVGRRQGSAGLVVTLYNWSRPRDRSHYENFRGYHQAFYRYVEAQSVTPFSARARDRALHAALFALARAELDELRPNDSPSLILKEHVEDRVRALASRLLGRIEKVETDLEDRMNAEAELQEIVEEWIGLAKDASRDRPLFWTNIVRKDEQSPPALARIMIGNDSHVALFPIQFSMRDVDAAASLVMQRVE